MLLLFESVKFKDLSYQLDRHTCAINVFPDPVEPNIIMLDFSSLSSCFFASKMSLPVTGAP